MPQFFIALLFDKWDLVQLHIRSLQWFLFFSDGQAIFELGGEKRRKGRAEEAEDVKILQG